MALIIEDGTIVANANSYVTLVEARAYALERGVVLSVTDSLVEVLAIKAKDYLEAQRSRYKGEKVSPSTQSLCWPRADAYIDNELWPSDTIPKELRYAQCQLIMEINAGVDTLPTSDEQFIVHEKVGAIETRYSDKVATSKTPSMPAVDNWLEPLCLYGSLLTTVRI